MLPSAGVRGWLALAGAAGGAEAPLPGTGGDRVTFWAIVRGCCPGSDVTHERVLRAGEAKVRYGKRKAR